MAHTLSAKKRIRQNTKRRLHNKGIKSAMRTQIKKTLMVIDEKKDAERSWEELKKVYKSLDKAVSKGLMHRNKAARTKSRLTTHFNKIKAGTTPKPDETTKVLPPATNEQTAPSGTLESPE